MLPDTCFSDRLKFLGSLGYNLNIFDNEQLSKLSAIPPPLPSARTIIVFSITGRVAHDSKPATVADVAAPELEPVAKLHC